ncbi:hypothetical protein CR513_12096, partial [Mucuna pruriens]
GGDQTSTSRGTPCRSNEDGRIKGGRTQASDSKQPFCEEIDEARITPHFREILMDPFDGTQDPHAHQQAFQT